MKAAWLCAVGLLVVNGLVPVRADDSVLPLCPPPDLATLPENPGAEPARRLATLATWEEKGPAAQEMLRLGALYRLGRAHPAALVDADLQKARDLLEQAALAGQLTAMASAAEIELRHGDAFFGMVWAQLYAHYVQRESPSRFNTYQADLIRRGFEALPPGEETEREIVRYVDGFIARYGGQIDAALAAAKQGAVGPLSTCRPVHAVYPIERRGGSRALPLAGGNNAIRRARMYKPGLALFLLHVTPSGEVSHAFVIESLPGPATAEGLLASVQRLRFNPVADDAPVRITLMPMSFGDGSLRLRR